jgi:hypothetical protein
MHLPYLTQFFLTVLLVTTIFKTQYLTYSLHLTLFFKYSFFFLLQWKPLDVVTINVIVWFMWSVHLLIIIIWLMISVLLSPKVITFSGAQCIFLICSAGECLCLTLYNTNYDYAADRVLDSNHKSYSFHRSSFFKTRKIKTWLISVYCNYQTYV